MKFVSYATPSDPERVGLLVEEQIIDLQMAARHYGFELPSRINDLLAGEQKFMDIARRVHENSLRQRGEYAIVANTTLLAPVPHPTSLRDGYAFRQHVETARRNRGVSMIAEFDQYPVFYFGNHNSVVGPGDVVVEQDHLQQLDFELEAAVVIGKRGKNIAARDADRYVAGYVIMNDLSARVLQMEEMKLSLGPAKGKDFATALGPWLVTPDELKAYEKSTDFGLVHNLHMTAYHNGTLVSNGNLSDMNWTFAEIIERASYGVELVPGDVIGSGTVGTGCFLELNGTASLQAKARNEASTPTWLDAGDTIELEITGLGRLVNRIVRAGNSRSLLALKKNVPA